jgi:hypothetical protein
MIIFTTNRADGNLSETRLCHRGGSLNNQESTMFRKLAISLSVLALTGSLNAACSDSPKKTTDAGDDAAAGTGGKDAAGGTEAGTGGAGGSDAAAEMATDTATETADTAMETGGETGDAVPEVLPTDLVTETPETGTDTAETGG